MNAYSHRRAQVTFGITVPIAVAAVVIVRVWMLPLTQSFWLDEAITAWIANGTFAEVIQRASITPQSILFCIIEWCMSHVATSEYLLRAPSLAASLGTVYVYFRIGSKLVDRGTGVVFASIFITLHEVAVQASNARPYALALFAQSLSIMFLFQWIRHPERRYQLLWPVFSALAVYLHPFFAASMAAQFMFATLVLRKELERRWRSLCFSVIVFAVLLIPLLPQTLFLVKNASAFVYATRMSYQIAFFAASVPVFVVGGTVLVLFITIVGGERVRWIRPPLAMDLILGAVYSLLACGMYCLAVCGIISAESRYLLPSIPGLIFLWGWILRGINPMQVRFVSITAALMAYLSFSAGTIIPDYRGEDWRSASESVGKSEAILLYSSLVESRRIEWLQAPDRWSYLAAPLVAYDPALSPKRVFILPLRCRSEEQKYVDSILAGPVGYRHSISVIMRNGAFIDGPNWIAWLRVRLCELGFREKSYESHGLVDVLSFIRVSASTGGRGG